MKSVINKAALIKGILHGKKAFIGPQTCEIDLTDKCNLRCIGCWTHSPALKNPPTQYKLKFDELRLLLLDLKKIGTKKVCFSGRGEPFLHEQLYETLDLCNKLNLKVIITSNGGYLSDYFIKNLGNYTIEILKISLWSLKPETLRALCPGHSLDSTFRKIKKITKKYKEKIRFNCIIAKQNIREIRGFIEKAHEIGMKYIKFEPIQLFEENKWMVLGKEEKDIFIKRVPGYVRLMGDYGIKSNIADFVKKIIFDKECRGLYNYKGNMPCLHGWTGVRILANRDVVFCCECVEKPIGNIGEKKFSAIWFSEPYSKLRGKALQEGCIDWQKGKINCSYGSRNSFIKQALLLMKKNI